MDGWLPTSLGKPQDLDPNQLLQFESYYRAVNHATWAPMTAVPTATEPRCGRCNATVSGFPSERSWVEAIAAIHLRRENDVISSGVL
jgi:hypothetical protein